MLQVLDRGYKDHLGREITGKMPIANQGDEGTYWVDYEVYFGTYLSFNLSLTITEGSSTYILNGANWADLGITAGDTLYFVNVTDVESNPYTSSNNLINLINGNEAIFDGSVAGHSRMYVGGEIHVVKAPQAVKTNLNLIPHDQPSGIASLIDATSLTLTNDSIGGMAVWEILPLDLIGNKSGGGVISANITRFQDRKGGDAKSYRVKVKFYWWYFLSNYADMFFDADCVTPYIESSFLPLWNNPNVALSTGFKPIGDGNSGYRDENFNQNPNNFEVKSMVWSDGSNTIAGFDYSQTSHFTIEIESLTGNGFGDNCGLIMFNDIEEQDEYSANQTNDNGDFSHLRHTIFSEKAEILTNGTVTAFNSYVGTNGEILSFNIEANIISGILTITGDTTPNSAFVQKFEDFNNTNKEFALLVRTESATFGASNYSDTVNLMAWRGEAESYPPILGGYFDSAILNDHANNLIHTY